jgi:large subunit ribosomal protein L6
MSRIGKLPVKFSENVTMKVEQENIMVKGPKGELKLGLSKNVNIVIENNTLVVKPINKDGQVLKLFGTYRAIINNMVIGVTTGFEKRLELQGVGYRAQLQGKDLSLSVGYSHPVIIKAPAGINITVENNTVVVISGIDKQLVGQIASNIRSIKPPEPYKGKGIRYVGEFVRKKAGKAGKK